VIVTAAQIATALRAFDEAVAVAVERLGVLACLLTTSIAIDAPAALIYELAKDQERFPQFMPDVESVTVVERHADRVLTRWKTLIERCAIEWLEEDASTTPRCASTTSCSKATSTRRGHVDVRCGGQRHGRCARRHLRLGVPTLAELIGPTLEKKCARTPR